MVKAVTQASDFVKHIHRPSGERWIRRINLLVYIYEATVAQVFTDYDYAPGLEYCGTSEIPLNVCQEGLDDLYDLQERGFILQLNLASRSHRTHWRVSRPCGAAEQREQTLRPHVRQ